MQDRYDSVRVWLSCNLHFNVDRSQVFQEVQAQLADESKSWKAAVQSARDSQPDPAMNIHGVKGLVTRIKWTGIERPRFVGLEKEGANHLVFGPDIHRSEGFASLEFVRAPGEI